MSKRGKTVCGAVVVSRRAQSNATRNTKKKDVSNVYHFRQSAAGCTVVARSKRAKQKTKKRCNVAMPTNAYCHCVIISFILQIHITLFHRAVVGGADGGGSSN